MTEIVQQETGDLVLDSNVLDLRSLLNKLDKDQRTPEVVEKKVRDSKERRVAEWKKADLDLERLVDLQGRMEDFVDKFFAKVNKAEGETLTKDEQEQLMAEYIEISDFDDAFQARRELIRLMVFSHLTAQNKALGEKDPENINGKIKVPSLGKEFCREGTGYKDSTVDLDLLKKVWGKEIWDKVTNTRTETKVITELDESAMIDEMNKNPQLLEGLRQALQPGALKSPRFQVRKINDGTG